MSKLTWNPGTLLAPVPPRRLKGGVGVKRLVFLFLAVVCLFGLSGCSQGKTEPYIVNTFEKTPDELVEESVENSKVIVTTAYYEMSDGTWKTDSHTYQYKLEITGRLRNAAQDSTYVILSNTDDITFEQAWKASGLSSNMDDYFKAEDAVFVGRA